MCLTLFVLFFWVYFCCLDNWNMISFQCQKIYKAIMTHNKEWRGLSEIHTVKSTSIFNTNRNWRFKPYKTIVLNRSWKRTCIPNKKRQPILKPSTLPKIRLMSRLEVFYLGPPLSLFRINIFECIWPPRERSYINCSSTWLLGCLARHWLRAWAVTPLSLSLSLVQCPIWTWPQTRSYPTAFTTTTEIEDGREMADARW